MQMDLYEVGWRGMDGIVLAQDRDRWWRTFGFHKMRESLVSYQPLKKASATWGELPHWTINCCVLYVLYHWLSYVMDYDLILFQAYLEG